jgi:lipopolysaccharide/colanic/teichoic acid biosynthesis glycosyltransferase/2-polyprenyl-3-methyl-5-hydroxy-6-metoxy-1,4-benzoquinol methylase
MRHDTTSEEHLRPESVRDLTERPTLQNRQDGPASTDHPWSRSARAVKRAFDVVFSLIVLGVTWPVLAVAAIAIRLDSRGPAFFVQERMGRGGTRFRLLKLRGMTVDSRERYPELYDYGGIGSAAGYSDLFPQDFDPRVTRVGRFLRRTAIDELPNFVNVLRGQMSIVGPRPEIPEMAELYEGALGRVLSVRPGVTSPAKARGRGALDFRETLALDLAYIEQRTLLLDVNTILRTAKSIASGTPGRDRAPDDAELRRITRAYRRYSTSRSENARRDPSNPGLRKLRSEWMQRLGARLTGAGTDLRHAQVLDLGCGDGALLSWFLEHGVAQSRCVGVELMPDRAASAARRLPEARIVRGNAASLPLDSSSFDVVCMSMLLSSVLADDLARRICEEAARLVRPEGVVVVYDTRYPNPVNRDVRAVPIAELRRLYPGFSIGFETVSLVPPLARGLRGPAIHLYPLLSRVPVLRARYLALLSPSDTKGTRA